MAKNISREQFKKQIEEDINWATTFYNKRNSDFLLYEKWIQKEHYPTSVPVTGVEEASGSDEELEHLTTINIPTAIVEDAHTMLTNEDPIVEVLTISKSDAASKSASRVERLLAGCYYMNRQVQGKDVIGDAIFNALVYGWGVLRGVWDTQLKQDIEGVMTAEGISGEAPIPYVPDFAFPIVVQSLHPSTVYPLPGGRYERWRGVFQYISRMVGEIEAEWNKKVPRKQAVGEDGMPLTNDYGGKIMEELFDDTFVDYVDYWCWKGMKIYHAVLANGGFIKPPTEMAEYEALPYEIFFCRPTSFVTGELYSLPFLFTIIDSVKQLELLANRAMRAIDLYADPALVLPVSGEVGDIEKGPGSTIVVEPGETPYYLQWQGNPPDVPRMIDFWQSLIREHGFPPVLSGAMGGTSGLDTIALQQGGLAKLFQIKRNAELALQRMNTKVIRMFQKFSNDEPLQVRGVRMEADQEHPFSFQIKGADTKGYEYTHVTIRAKFPQEELRNAAIAQGLEASGLMPKEDIMTKFLYIQDPERAQEIMRREKAFNNMKWLDYILQKLTVGPSSPIAQALQESQPAANVSQSPEVQNLMAALQGKAGGGAAAGGPAAGPAQVGPASAAGAPPQAANAATYLRGKLAQK